MLRASFLSSWQRRHATVSGVSEVGAENDAVFATDTKLATNWYQDQIRAFQANALYVFVGQMFTCRFILKLFSFKQNNLKLFGFLPRCM